MITIQTTIKVPINKAWDYWTNPEHITKWNFASTDWHCPKAENNFIKGGSFSYTMAAIDGSAEFDFKGTYEVIEPLKRIQYKIEDGRKVNIFFEISAEDFVKITEQFEPEKIHAEDLQQQGWQSILNQFKKYAESLS